MNSAFKSLTKFDAITRGLCSLADRSGWDQETMMPKGASEQRSEEVAAIQEVIHSRRTDPRIGDWLELAETDDTAGKASLRIIRNDYNNYNKIPIDLAVEIARLSSEAHNSWLEARKSNKFSIFSPSLKKMVLLKREEGQALNEYNAYEGLLEKFEPGISFNKLDEMFGRMRPRLIKLRKRVLASGIITKPLCMNFDEQKQMKLAKELARTFGLDFNRSRIDKAVHPFSSGTGSDVRLTTRTSINDPFNCIYSTIHEVGHACYDQNIDKNYILTALGQGASNGVHESQSRLFECQLGRSRPFTDWLFTRMTDYFSDFGVKNNEEFYRLVNKVENGYVRTEADEVNYNLHIMLRFDLEYALISEKIQVDQIEDFWNERFSQDFDMVITKPTDGVLQDVHWSVGALGYFPGYTLGNIYSACLMNKMKNDVVKLDEELSQGKTTQCVNWLNNEIHKFGSLYQPVDLITLACGKEPSEVDLLDYLDKKYEELYNL